MLVTIPEFILGTLFNAYVNFTNSFGNSLPSWLQDGWNQIFQSGGKADNFLPVYPHPEMTGIVHSVGLVTIVGFVASMFLVITVIGILIIGLVLLLRILPWSTSE